MQKQRWSMNRNLRFLQSNGNRLLGLVGPSRAAFVLEKSLPQERSGTIIVCENSVWSHSNGLRRKQQPFPVRGAYVNSRGTSHRLGGPDSRFNCPSHLSRHSDNAGG